MTTATVNRRALAESLAHDIAGQPGLNRHLIGEGDQVCDIDGPTGYRMEDFTLTRHEWETYRTFCYGSPEATAETPCASPPPQLDDCTGDCAGGHWGPRGMSWHYSRQAGPQHENAR